jgi:hypothetical protein
MDAHTTSGTAPTPVGRAPGALHDVQHVLLGDALGHVAGVPIKDVPDERERRADAALRMQSMAERAERTIVEQRGGRVAPVEREGDAPVEDALDHLARLLLARRGRHGGDRHGALAHRGDLVERVVAFQPGVLDGDRDGDVDLARQRAGHGREEVPRVLRPVALGPAVCVLDAHDELEAARTTDVTQRPQPAAAVERLGAHDADEVLPEREAQTAARAEDAGADVDVEARPAVLGRDALGDRAAEPLALIAGQVGLDRGEHLADGGPAERREVARLLHPAGDGDEDRQVPPRRLGRRRLRGEPRRDVGERRALAAAGVATDEDESASVDEAAAGRDLRRGGEPELGERDVRLSHLPERRRRREGLAPVELAQDRGAHATNSRAGTSS